MKKRFGSKTVLDGITFSHCNGVLGIAGSNGSGKSTLLKCLAGLLKPTSGEVEWKKDEQRLGQSDLKTSLGYVAPYINLYHELSIIENLRFILQLRRISQTGEAIERVLAQFQLTGIKEQPFGELSTGQQQRARLASTLIYNPPVLFLDEPGANLDEEGRNAIREVVNHSRQQRGLVFLASNNPEELDLADRIFSVEQIKRSG